MKVKIDENIFIFFDLWINILVEKNKPYLTDSGHVPRPVQQNVPQWHNEAFYDIGESTLLGISR